MDHKQTSLAWADRPLEELLRLSWPMVVQLLSLSLMSFVDTLFIGWLGWVELAAVGLGAMCTFTVISFGMAIFSAARVEVGQLHGRGDDRAVQRALGAFLRLAVALGLFCLGLGLLAAWSLPWLSVDAHSGRLAAHYAGIRSVVFPIVLIGSAIGQWLAAQGDSKSAMHGALIANLANIPLNAVLIFALGWGLHGAAIASALSGLVETLYLVHVQVRGPIALDGARTTTPGLHLNRAGFRDAWTACVRGLPTGLERVLDMMAFSAIPILLAQIGAIHVAAHQVVLQLLLIAFLPSIALSDAVSVLVSQAVGAQRQGLERRLSHLGLGVGLGYALLCAALYLSLGELLVRIFSSDRALIRVAVPALSYGALLQFLNAVYNHYKGMLRGLSIFRYVAWVAVGCAWIATPPLTYLWAIQGGQGVKGAWMALCAEVTVGVLLVAVRTHRHAAFDIAPRSLAVEISGR